MYKFFLLHAIPFNLNNPITFYYFFFDFNE